MRMIEWPKTLVHCGRWKSHRPQPQTTNDKRPLSLQNHPKSISIIILNVVNDTLSILFRITTPHSLDNNQLTPPYHTKTHREFIFVSWFVVDLEISIGFCDLESFIGFCDLESLAFVIVQVLHLVFCDSKSSSHHCHRCACKDFTMPNLVEEERKEDDGKMTMIMKKIKPSPTQTKTMTIKLQMTSLKVTAN